MPEIVLLVVGGVLGYVLGWSLGKRGGRHVSAPLAPQAARSMRPPEDVERDVAEIRAFDAELADQIAAAPAVQPESVPAVIDEPTRERHDPEQILSRISHPDLRDVLRALWGWNPRSREGDERGYVNSMLVHVRKNGVPTNEVERDPRIQWPGSKRWAQPDVVVRKNVLIEIKADLTTSSASDRSLGQMLRYLLAFKTTGPAVLIVCGECDPLMSMIVRQYVEVWRNELRLPVTVWFARTESVAKVEDRVISLEGRAAG